MADGAGEIELALAALIDRPPHLGTMFHDIPVPRFGTKFPERGTCPCSRTRLLRSIRRT
jgi:hypothetical protein